MDTGAVSEGLGPSGGTGGILAGTGGGGGGGDPCLSPVFADIGAAWSALPGAVGAGWVGLPTGGETIAGGGAFPPLPVSVLATLDGGGPIAVASDIAAEVLADIAGDVLAFPAGAVAAAAVVSALASAPLLL